MRISRLLLATVLVATLAACGTEPPEAAWTDRDRRLNGGSGAAPAGDVPVTKDVDSLAVIGHSGASGAGTSDRAGSWATGTSIESLAERLLRRHPKLVEHVWNAAEDGSGSGALSEQLRALEDEVTVAPDLVVVQTGGNDFRCDGRDDHRAEALRGHVDEALSRIGAVWPAARVLVLGAIDDERNYAEIMAGDDAASDLGFCGILDADLQPDLEGVAEGQRVRDLMSAALYDACAGHASCFTDRGRLSRLHFVKSDYSGDLVHRAEVGQEKTADVVWGLLPARFRKWAGGTSPGRA